MAIRIVSHLSTYAQLSMCADHTHPFQYFSPSGTCGEALEDCCFNSPVQTPSDSALNALRLYAAAALLLLSLAACGPEIPTADREQLLQSTEQIAQEYASDSNLNRARAALSNMAVANPNQWVVYVTETSIRQDPSSELTQALVGLALDLSLTSALIEEHIVNVGFIEPTVDSESSALPQANDLAPVEPHEGVAAARDELVITKQIDPQEEARVLDEVPVQVEEQRADTGEEARVATVGSLIDLQKDKATPTDIPSVPLVTASAGLNVRAGPSTDYGIVAGLAADQSALVIARNTSGDWWQVQLDNGTEGWVFGPLVSPSGNVGDVAIAQNIAPPPPVPTPTAAPLPPAAEESPKPSSPASGHDFVLVEKRLWDVTENGGRMDGPSLICGEKRELHVYVVDAGGAPLNGVAIQEQYGAKEIQVTGAQGKGDGKVEFVLGRGQDVKVIRDVDGRQVSSDLASGMITVPADIPTEYLIQGGYCQDEVSCRENIVKPYACGGHWSWTVKFQRQY